MTQVVRELLESRLVKVCWKLDCLVNKLELAGEHDNLVRTNSSLCSSRTYARTASRAFLLIQLLTNVHTNNILDYSLLLQWHVEKAFIEFELKLPIIEILTSF